MKRKMMTVVMAMSVMAAIGNVCSAQETEAVSNETELAELVLVDEADAVEWDLSEQQLSEAFAYAAYNISENYLKPNDISRDSITLSDDEGEWFMPGQYFLYLANMTPIYRAENPEISCEEIIDKAKIEDYTEDIFHYMLSESIFTYRYCIENNYFYFTHEQEDTNAEGRILMERTIENLTFSDEQLKLGEAVAQELAEVEAN